MEEAASAGTEPTNTVYDTLIDLFGPNSKEKIEKAIELTRQGGNDGVVQLETAIEIMFELLNQESAEETKESGKPTTLPPQKPSRSNIQTGTKKKMPINNFSSSTTTTSKEAGSSYYDREMEQRSAKFLPEEYKTAIDMIDKGYKVMILMRGLPGSGKSFLARQLVQHFNFDARNHIFSADNYFVNVNGEYIYDQTKLTEAHEYTQACVVRKLRDYWSPVIVDNTNIKLWNMFPYIRLGVQYRYKIIIMEPVTPWATTPKTLTEKNKHNVPKERIRQMMDNYERTNLVKLLHTLNLHEAYMTTPTEYRHYPPFTRKFLENHKEDFPELQKPETTRKDEPKPRRSIFEGHVRKEESTSNTPSESIHVTADTIDWQSYEQDNFWSKIEGPGSPEHRTRDPTMEIDAVQVPKPKRDNVSFNLLDTLQEMAREERQKFQTEQQQKELMEKQAVPELIREQEDLQKELVKHKKDCRNENKIFREIRLMFPNIGINHLWDLFLKCDGDPDWIINLLISDPMVCQGSDADVEDFECEKCDTGKIIYDEDFK